MWGGWGTYRAVIAAQETDSFLVSTLCRQVESGTALRINDIDRCSSVDSDLRGKMV